MADVAWTLDSDRYGALLLYDRHEDLRILDAFYQDALHVWSLLLLGIAVHHHSPFHNEKLHQAILHLSNQSNLLEYFWESNNLSYVVPLHPIQRGILQKQGAPYLYGFLLRGYNGR